MIIHKSTEETLTREVPTHLFQFQEKIFGFFTIPQLLYDTVAFTGLWYLYNQTFSIALRIAISVIYTLAVIFVVHIKIKGRNITEWIYLYARFFATPSQAVWRPVEQVTMMSIGQSSKVPSSVQSTWIPLRSIEKSVMGFTQKRATKGKQEEPERFCTILEVGGINLAVLSYEEQTRLFGRYETFLAGLHFPLQTHSSNENIDIQTYAPVQAQLQHLSALSKTPRLQALAQKSLQFQSKTISVCMTTRHFVIVSATLSEFAVQPSNGKSPSILAVLFTFGSMRKRAQRQVDEVLQELHIRTKVVIKGLTEIGLSVEQLDNPRLAQFYASSLCPGAQVLPFTQFESPYPLGFQPQRAVS